MSLVKKSISVWLDWTEKTKNKLVKINKKEKQFFLKIGYDFGKLDMILKFGYNFQNWV
jgi:hypothetical protein